MAKAHGGKTVSRNMRQPAEEWLCSSCSKVAFSLFIELASVSREEPGFSVRGQCAW